MEDDKNISACEKNEVGTPEALDEMETEENSEMLPNESSDVNIEENMHENQNNLFEKSDDSNNNSAEQKISDVSLDTDISENTSNIQVEKTEENECIVETNPSENYEQDKTDEVVKCDENQVTPTVKYNFDTMRLIASSKNFFTTDNYLKGCKWSPDGSCLLINCAEKKLHLFDLPHYLYTTEELNVDKDISELKPSLTVKDGGLVYDFDWYPHMSSWSPETCCFVSTSSQTPIHLFDAFTGKIRATYSGMNLAEEVVHAFCVKFGFSGDKIYSGYTHFVKIFDTSVPGNECFSLNVKLINNQRGIISCIAQNPAWPVLFAVGSYRQTIGLYTDQGESVCLLKGQKGGLTHLVYSQDGTKLFSGARKDDEILCWDLRNPGSVLHTIHRKVKTNQRIYFEITPDGQHLVTGGTDGLLKVYDIHNGVPSQDDPFKLYKTVAYRDCVNGVSFNSKFPLLATSSGQQHFCDVISDEDDESFFTPTKNINTIENTVKIWWLGKISSKD